MPASRPVRFPAELLVKIRKVHAANYGVYGSRRVWKALLRQGIDVARCTVERLMREAGIEGRSPRRRRRLTIADPQAERPADLVERIARQADHEDDFLLRALGGRRAFE